MVRHNQANLLYDNLNLCRYRVDTSIALKLKLATGILTTKLVLETSL